MEVSTEEGLAAEEKSRTAETVQCASSGQQKRARQNSAKSGGNENGNVGAKKPREYDEAETLETLGSQQTTFVSDSDTGLSQSLSNISSQEIEKSQELKLKQTSEDSNIGNESDSDLDYDDLDDLAVSSDVADFIEDDFVGGDSDEDDTSIVSSTTSLSTGSVSSTTPSLVGENLESVNIGGTSGATETKKVLKWLSVAPNLTDSPALRRSLFSNVPPTINFMLHNEISAHQLPDNVRKLLKWKLSTITPAIVKRTTSNSGYRLMRKTCQDWNATWGKHMKSNLFKGVLDTQKINHFPGTFNIGRKDKLWRNYHRLMLKHGKAEFGFLPRTFVLPGDAKLLKKVWERRGAKGRWILKPPALARGVGISVVNKLSKIPRNKPLVVQRYVARPYLINGTKFDLRIYLLVTSINPLRMYLYDDGLVRFASNKYSNDSACVDDVYMHLTNYSINKKSSNYTSNEDSESCQGHKWTLKSLWRHFDAEGIDHTVVWEKVKDLMIKTVISAETSMSNLFQSNVSSRYSCFELFGFDILLDSKLKPWLIEVNISPSLHSSSSLDLDVKSHLTTEVFNMARYHIPNKIKGVEQREIGEKLGYPNLLSLCLDRRLYVKEISKAERVKHDSVVEEVKSSGSLLPPTWILDHLTPDDTRQLVVAEDELATSRRFSRIFPTKDTHKYFKYFEKPRYYNLLLAAWEQKYSANINLRQTGHQVLEKLCQLKHHLKVPACVYVKKTSSGQHQTIDISCLAAPSSETSKTDPHASSQPADEVACAPALNGPENPPGESLPDHGVTQSTYCTSSANHQPSVSLDNSVSDIVHKSHVLDRESGNIEESRRESGNVEESRRMSAGSCEMDTGESVTPSPAGTPEYPGGDCSSAATNITNHVTTNMTTNTSMTTDLNIVNDNYRRTALSGSGGSEVCKLDNQEDKLNLDNMDNQQTGPAGLDNVLDTNNKTL